MCNKNGTAYSTAPFLELGKVYLMLSFLAVNHRVFDQKNSHPKLISGNEAIVCFSDTAESYRHCI